MVAVTQECVAASQSAAHAQRPPAWCAGRFVSSHMPPRVDLRDVCMLTPVHKPNFGQLAHRLERTDALSMEAPPTTVAVFDDEAAAADFCRTAPRACALSHFVRLNLRTLIGDEAYATASGMLRTGNYQARERLRDQAHGRSNALARQCPPKFGGQCYQSLKKFYGAAEGPAHCRVYWVSDAESFPFRRFNFSALVAHTVVGRRRSVMASTSQGHAMKPFLVVPSWYPSRYGCDARVNLFNDGDCATWIVSMLSLGKQRGASATDGGSSSSATAIATSSPFDHTSSTHGEVEVVPASAAAAAARAALPYKTPLSRPYQTVFDVNNWWFYERQMARALIDRTEQTVGAHFVKYFASLQVPDINFWRTNFDVLSRMPNSPMVPRDFLHTLERAFPSSFARCCVCNRPGATNATLPCKGLADLWSPCFMRHETPEALASFVVEELGMFGIFGNEMDNTPDAVLRADSRLSWVVNNGYKWRGAVKYGAAPRTDSHSSTRVRTGANGNGNTAATRSGRGGGGGLGVSTPVRFG